MNVQFLKKLWENPSPTAAFAAQNITLSSDDYDFLLVIHNSVAGQSYGNYSWIGKKGDTISCTYSAYAGTTLYVGSRRLSTNGTSCAYTDNAYTGNGASTTENLRNVPLVIYGFKASVDVDITAYMADLFTDAKNVYLENDESVEDGIKIKTLDASTLITPYNNTVTIKHCEMYQWQDLITIECAVEVSSATANAYVIGINSAYRPKVFDTSTNAVGVCVARLTSITSGATYQANVWVVSDNGNVMVTADTACKAFIFRLQYRKA